MQQTAPQMIGSSPAFLAMLDHISSIAAIARPVLVLGERGTGKELAAARLHFLSHVWDGPYVTLNCAALTPTLLDAELFGAEAGAYTGANKQRLGRFERADGGSLFLDEIGTAPLETQEKLLRAIEYGRFERVGGQKSLTATVRIIAATNEDLPAAVAQGQFRADLLDRLTFDVVHMPPLRHRQEDITELAHHFSATMAAELGWTQRPQITDAAMAHLIAHDWPGNIRELKNVSERTIARTTMDQPVTDILLDAMTPPWDLAPAAPPSTNITITPRPMTAYNFKEHLNATARRWLQDAMAQHAGNQTETAKFLGLNYFQLRHLLGKHGLAPTDPTQSRTKTTS